MFIALLCLLLSAIRGAIAAIVVAADVAAVCVDVVVAAATAFGFVASECSGGGVGGA